MTTAYPDPVWRVEAIRDLGFADCAVPLGTAGVIVNVESHGNAPHTRYTVDFANGVRRYGLAYRHEIKAIVG